MDNKQKLIGVFASVFGITAAEAEMSAFRVTRQWDSVGHVNLMNSIEEVFGISLDPDDIIDFKSFSDGLDILRKYGVH